MIANKWRSVVTCRFETLTLGEFLFIYHFFAIYILPTFFLFHHFTKFCQKKNRWYLGAFNPYMPDKPKKKKRLSLKFLIDAARKL
jgi:hypothetical protein